MDNLDDALEKAKRSLMEGNHPDKTIPVTLTEEQYELLQTLSWVLECDILGLAQMILVKKIYELTDHLKAMKEQLAPETESQSDHLRCLLKSTEAEKKVSLESST